MAVTWARPASARIREDEPEYKDLQGLMQQFRVGPYKPPDGSTSANGTLAVPDIFGPGAVLTVGNIFMKCTNYGFDGNPFTNLSTDPSGQWPGASGIEYLNYIGLAVGAVNPLATDPTAMRRVSYITEWRPPTLDPEDRMYRSYDGIVNGQRYVNDDGDTDPLTGEPRIDEDFLDGRDNDGDGKIDEDFAALGQMMYTCVMRDDTPQAINASAAERHVPLGLSCNKSCWAYSIPGYTDFNVIQYDVYNVSGHMLDSLVIGFRTDMDCGPVTQANYWTDDFNLPQYPHGDFIIKTRNGDLRRQDGRVHEDGSNNDDPHAQVPDVDPDSALCPRYKLRVTAWSTVDDNGDDGKTTGIATVQLIDHTIDPLGISGPSKVGLHCFRSFPGGTPYASGGSPTIDQQRYEMLTSTDPGSTHIDPLTGFISSDYTTGEQKGDYSDWAGIGPWLRVPDGGHIQATIAFSVQPGNLALATKFPVDYNNAVNPTVGAVTDGRDLLSKYPSLENCLAAQIAFAGGDERRDTWPWLTDFHGRETAVIAPRGQTLYIGTPCTRDNEIRTVTEYKRVWFDFDCDYCTGSYSVAHGGLFHRSWLAEAPPPSPNDNLAINYNYTDNPDRKFVPAGDHQVTLAWDNLSETTPDPKSAQFDFRGYKVWKVSDWKRPVGSGGPLEDDWTLLADYRLFDGRADNGLFVCTSDSVANGKCPAESLGMTIYPVVYVPTTGTYKRLVLHRGDLWNSQDGTVLSPDTTVQCIGYPNCLSNDGYALGQIAGAKITHLKYPVGRYHLVDHQVKNGFLYFYSVTAYDSTGRGSGLSMLNSRRSAVEAEGVVPQSAATVGSKAGSGVWVVPNPYRGGKQLNQRPSAWDLTPNASDPTGTHIDFFGLPSGEWTISIFTVSGDLVQTIRSSDPVNESIRPAVTGADGKSRPGYNRQQDSPDDGQARWNLISRNGQDVVSGIYLFTVQAGGQVKHRGRFVIIR
jgi:hypothetical protein